MIITYQAGYSVHEELNEVHAIERKVGKLLCPMIMDACDVRR
ncbi:hypothetical protein [Lactobacillus helveticus]|nr:hypothetical protein [Lactobacillus helveticus]